VNKTGNIHNGIDKSTVDMYCMWSNLDSILEKIEQGLFFLPIQLIVFVIFILILLLFSIKFSSQQYIATTERTKIYSIKKVSAIPRDKLDRVADSSENISSDGLTPEELYNNYMRYVVSRIEQYKYYPESEQKLGHEGTVSLRLYLQRNGRVEKVVFLQHSRFSKLNEAAIESIKRAIPFLPFPKGIPYDEITLDLTLTFNLL